MKHHLASLSFSLLLPAVALAAAPKTVPAWRNAVDAASAASVLQAYTSNVIRCEWAGPDDRVRSMIPANLGFQFAVSGKADVTNRVQAMLEATAAAIDPKLRAELEHFGLLNPTLQWIVRSSRPGMSKRGQYTNPRNHPAVFKESDFVLPTMTDVARRLTGNKVPYPVRIEFDYSPDKAPLGRAVPGADYPDILPEETFVTPHGAAIVLRAPEVRRKIKLRAWAYPASRRKVKYIWRATGAGRFVDWTPDAFATRDRGYAYFVYESSKVGVRTDIMVFALVDDALCGAPTIISIYSPPFAKRKFEKGKLHSIDYVLRSNIVPYDVSPIWIPHEWRDEYIRDSRGRTMSISRYLPGQFRPQAFSATGELALSLSASGYPIRTQAVEYFADEKSGALSYRPTGPEKDIPFGSHPSRLSGE